MIDENGTKSQKGTFKVSDKYMFGLNFGNFLDFESRSTNWSKANLYWRKDLHGVKKPHRMSQFSECNNNKKFYQYELKPQLTCFGCELVRT